MPAEVGQVKSQREAGLEEVLAFLDLMGFVIDKNGNHKNLFP
jgi:hypothetical protein